LENGNYAAGDTFGLEKIGGSREVEDPRRSFIIPLGNHLTDFKKVVLQSKCSQIKKGPSIEEPFPSFGFVGV